MPMLHAFLYTSSKMLENKTEFYLLLYQNKILWNKLNKRARTLHCKLENIAERN